MADDLPANWVRKESRSRPGRFYFANSLTGQSVWRRDQISSNEKVNKKDTNLKNISKQANTVNPSSKKWKPISQSSTSINDSTDSEPSASVKKTSSKTRLDKKIRAKSSHRKHNLHHGDNLVEPESGQRSKTKFKTQNTKVVPKEHSSSQNLPLETTSKSPQPSQSSSKTNNSEDDAGSNDHYARNSKNIITKSNSEESSNSGNKSEADPTQKLKIVLKSSAAKKVAEQVEKFDQLVEKSALNSEYIDLEGPLGSKHVKNTLPLMKHTGLLPSSLALKSKRYKPFPTNICSPSLRQMTQDERMRRSKSDTTVDKQQPDKHSSSLTRKTKPKKVHWDVSPDATKKSASEETVAEEDSVATHFPTTQCNVTPTTAVTWQSRSPPPSSAPADVHRIINFSLEDDWDMMSDDGEGYDNSIVSFDLYSDVVMASMSQEDVGAQSSVSANLTLDREPKVFVVIDTCSMGNLSSLIGIQYLLIADEDSEEMVEYSLHKLIIPWQVLQELDILKDNKSGTFSSSKQNKAQKIAKFIYNELQNRSSKVKLQSHIDDAAEVEGFRIQTADDHIIKCCLTLQKKVGSHNKVVLVTEDINLINKCTACEIMASEFLKLRVGSSSQVSRKKLIVDSPRNLVKKKPSHSPLAPRSPPRAVIKPFTTPAMLSANAGSPSALSPVELATTPDLTNISKSPCLAKMEHNEVKEVLNKLEDLVKPVFCKCLAMELREVFGDLWETMVYRKPPWDTFLPVLESFSKHWMAVFGMILSRHAVKSVQTLQNMFKKCTGSAEEVIEVVIAAITLIRAFDVARRSYSAEARTLLPMLSELLESVSPKSNDEDIQCENIYHQVEESHGADCPSASSAVSADLNSEVANELTKIFTTLDHGCKNVGGTNAKQAVDVVMGLGTAYQRALSDPIQTESVQQFLLQLNSVSLLLNLQESKISVENLGTFISYNRPLMLEGLAHLERLALDLHSKL